MARSRQGGEFNKAVPTLGCSFLTAPAGRGRYAARRKQLYAFARGFRRSRAAAGRESITGGRIAGRRNSRAKLFFRSR